MKKKQNNIFTFNLNNIKHEKINVIILTFKKSIFSKIMAKVTNLAGLMMSRLRPQILRAGNAVPGRVGWGEVWGGEGWGDGGIKVYMSPMPLILQALINSHPVPPFSAEK